MVYALIALGAAGLAYGLQRTGPSLLTPGIYERLRSGRGH